MRFHLFAALSFCLLASQLCAQVAATKNLGQTETEWKGVSFVVTNLVRVDSGHILVELRINADATAVYPTLIGKPPEAGFLPPNPTIAQGLDPRYRPRAFSLVSSRLLDQKSGSEYPAVTDLPPAPYWGPNSIITQLGPTTWIQLAVQFNAPPPLPPNPNGKVEPQKVTLIFPKGKSPITGVILPPDVYKPPAP